MSRRNWPAILPSQGKQLDLATLAFVIDDLRSLIAGLAPVPATDWVLDTSQLDTGTRLT